MLIEGLSVQLVLISKREKKLVQSIKSFVIVHLTWDTGTFYSALAYSRSLCGRLADARKLG
jgi:hypothetical protein